MPGVGKTLMMEKIWKEIEEKKIFDKVIRADVGCERSNITSGKEELDVIKLQNQIAGYLDCHFESKQDQKRRANQLRHSFMNGGKILVILDDVWSEIPLYTIGIPFIDDSSTNGGSKILLTSRKLEVCLHNNYKYSVKISTLMLTKPGIFLGTPLVVIKLNLYDNSGLPLLIHAVGKALQFMSHKTWKDALYQLENGRAENIPGIDPDIYACVKLSIDKLPDDAKSCLFLCSLFPEDSEIHIRMLTQLATSSQLVDGGRSRVSAMVDVLKSSSLLLEGRSIAVADQKYAFLLARPGKRLHNNVTYDTRKLLRLDIESPYFCSLDIPVCPNLHSLWLQCNYYKERFSGGFFDMFMNLKFLVLQNVFFHSSSHQFSLEPLDALRTLLLDDCDLNDIYETDRLFPENLQTLCIWGCRLPVPLHLTHLIHLQKLEIQPECSGGYFAPNYVSSQVYLVPNTMTSLSSLEELHIPTGFKFWMMHLLFRHPY
ncbi:disease resistance protein At4g27190-like [Apium graveolens]|uniref:disease resistance protein At4g27190-like n=1 Tax=Apium graveolens TaxID=4045 RepID=UPI003D7A7F05